MVKPTRGAQMSVRELCWDNYKWSLELGREYSSARGLIVASDQVSMFLRDAVLT
jgi:hypothetical protein